MADAEEERVLVIGKVNLVSFSVAEQLLQLLERLARNEHALFATDAFEVFVGLFNEGEAVSVRGDHGERLSLDDEQGAVQRVAGLLVGDGEDGARDEGLERDERNAGGWEGGKLGNLRIVGASHADDLGVGASAADLDPVVLKKLDGDFTVGQQFDVVVELACGDGAGAGLFYLDGCTGANSLVEVGRRDVQAVIFRFKEKVRQNRNGGFALDHALRRREFSNQILAAYGNLHRCPLCGRLLYFGFTDWHMYTPRQEAK